MLKGHPFESMACMMKVKEENKSKIDLGLGLVIDDVARFNTYNKSYYTHHHLDVYVFSRLICVSVRFYLIYKLARHRNEYLIAKSSSVLPHLCMQVLP